jgi:hypothetical protein
VSTLRIERGERVLDHAASVFNQREHLRRWRQVNDVSIVNHLAPSFVIARRIEKYVSHGAPFLIILPTILVCNHSTSSCLIHIAPSLVAKETLAEGNTLLPALITDNNKHFGRRSALSEGLAIAGAPAVAVEGRDMASQTAIRSCLVLASHPDDETLGCGVANEKDARRCG